MPSVTCGEPSQVKHPASAGGGEQDAKVFQVTPGVTLVDLERCSFRDERLVPLGRAERAAAEARGNLTPVRELIRCEA